MAKGHKCPACGHNTLQTSTTNFLKCSRPECGARIPKANLGK